MIARILLVCSLVVFVNGAALAQKGQAGSINGFIEDSVSKETLVGILAKLKGTKFGAYTNKSGYFSIGSVPAGTYRATHDSSS